MSDNYNTNLSAAQGIPGETRILLKLWQPGMEQRELFAAALDSGQFPTVSARRLRNIVYFGFAPRFLDRPDTAPQIRRLESALSRIAFDQILFLFAARANSVFGDFVREVYWPAYGAGRDTISKEDALMFVQNANDEGLTTARWSDKMVDRMASYLNGVCADFGLLDARRTSTRQIQPVRIQPTTVIYLAYDLHFQNVGDNTLLTHKDWALFGLERADVLEELRRMALRKWIILQTAAGVTRIDWLYDNMEDVIDGIVEREI